MNLFSCLPRPKNFFHLNVIFVSLPLHNECCFILYVPFALAHSHKQFLEVLFDPSICTELKLASFINIAVLFLLLDLVLGLFPPLLRYVGSFILPKFQSSLHSLLVRSLFSSFVLRWFGCYFFLFDSDKFRSSSCQNQYQLADPFSQCSEITVGRHTTPLLVLLANTSNIRRRISQPNKKSGTKRCLGVSWKKNLTKVVCPSFKCKRSVRNEFDFFLGVALCCLWFLWIAKVSRSSLVFPSARSRAISHPCTYTLWASTPYPWST